jgi:Mn2+/Fe2+ NRAMP family transporter
MKKLIAITLGIMTALGGFVDFGQIVFTMQAGSLFRYRLIWTIVLGTVAIITYMEMCGRVAVVARKPVFVVVRDCLGPRFGLAVLIASNLLNIITCAAEVGGIGIIVRFLTGWPEKVALLASAAVLAATIAALKFKWIERVFGLGGLTMVVFGVSAVLLHPDWKAVAHGLIPLVRPKTPGQDLLYWYFAVGIFSAMLMEYEVHFYSSGAMEEGWKPKDLTENFAVASFGSVLGALLTVALLVLGAIVFLPRGIFPESIGVTTMAGALPFEKTGLILALAGTLACLSGAAVETALSGAYNHCQFFRRPWGKNQPMKNVPTFTRYWLGMLVIAAIIPLSGLTPLKLVNISVVFGMALMPFTYYPILRVAMSKKIMGRHVNRPTDTAVGVVVLTLIVIAAGASIPLMIATNFGQP